MITRHDVPDGLHGILYNILKRLGRKMAGCEKLGKVSLLGQRVENGVPNCGQRESPESDLIQGGGELSTPLDKVSLLNRRAGTYSF